MKFSIGDTLSAETTGNPLKFTPRFDITSPCVIVAGYADPEGRERLLGATFGSMQWLWSEIDEVRFDPHSRELVGATFYVPRELAPAQVCQGLSDDPRPQPAGLRADAVEEFSLPQATVFCCGSDAAELTCLRDLGALDGPLDARISIGPDVDLLVQGNAVVGWSLTDPARYLTDGFADPDTAPPSPATRLRLAECMELVSSPLVDEVMDQDADAWRRLRATERALRDQRDDRHRADVLHRVVSRLIEDYE
ncbi:MAG: hypothetical protein JO362_16905 [Streptomycetaceae bacterium]|nr:hypothetical protein [Streptomycetaceae bacterium]